MRLCGVEGCDRQHVARGWCRHHYDSYRRLRDPLAAKGRQHPDGLLTSTDVLARVPGITYRQLDYWTRYGWITPAVEASGSGTYRYWSEQQVDALAAIQSFAAQFEDLTSGAMWARLTAADEQQVA